MWKILVVLSFAIVFLSLACEDEEPKPASPTRPALTQEMIDAVAAYVRTTGLDSDTFGLTDPLECDAIAALVDAVASEQEAGEIIQGTAGKLCFGPSEPQIGESKFTTTVGIYGTEAIWELLLTREDSDWKVSDVEYVGQ